MVTLNLPRAAHVSGDKKAFSTASRADAPGLRIAGDQTQAATLPKKGLYATAGYLSGIRSAARFWGNHFSTIGLIGMNEASLNTVGVSIDRGGARPWR
ncbi:MAG: anaerobic ribonucleoside-triphosphate reductase [Syntrophotaleaceae bacterium]